MKGNVGWGQFKKSFLRVQTLEAPIESSELK